MARLILCLLASLVALCAWVAIAAAHGARDDGRSGPAYRATALPAGLPLPEVAGGVAWSRQPMLP